MGPALPETPREESPTSELYKVVKQLRSLWLPVILGGVNTGIQTSSLSYIGLNFFAQQYTSLRPEDIHCEDTPELVYCQAAIKDNLFWSSIIGAAGSFLHFTLGPFLGSLSDTIGRRPVILLCSFLGYPSLMALILFVYRNTSLYYTFALLPLAELPVLAIWFAFIVDLMEDTRDSSVAFGLIMAAGLLATMLGTGIGAALTLKAGVLVMAIVYVVILLPYLVCCLPETLPSTKRQPLSCAAAAPGLGLGILARNALFVQLSTLVIGSTFIGNGFQRVSTSFLQTYVHWPKSCNNFAIAIAMASSVAWAGVGLSFTTRIAGDVGTLGLALFAGALYMLCFAFVTEAWHVYLLNAVLLGPQALAFPATSAIKSRLVAESEQGQLQGALTTGKSIAESLGPLIFSFLFQEGTAMLRVWLSSGAELAAVPVDEVPDVKSLKMRLCPVCGTSRFRQRLLHAGSDLPDIFRIDHPMDFNLVLLPFAESTQEQMDELAEAARGGRQADVEGMLQRPQDPNRLGVVDAVELEAPLVLATLEGHMEVVSLLLEAKANPNFYEDVDGLRGPSLNVACSGRSADIVHLLLEAGADTNHVCTIFGTPGETALGCACESGHLEAIRALLDAGADKNLAHNGGPPLCIATEFDHLQAVRYLLHCGALQDLPDECGLTSLLWASSKGHMEIATLLIDFGAAKNAANPIDITALVCASCRGHVEIVRLLLAADPGREFVGNVGELGTALIAASNQGNVQTVHLLLEAQADEELLCKLVPSALFCATCWGYERTVRVLLDFLADRGWACDCGLALTCAVDNGQTEIARLLQQAQRATGRWAPLADGTAVSLMNSARRGDGRMIEMLLEAGASENLADHARLTILASASHTGDIEIMSLLLQTLGDTGLAGSVSPPALAFVCAVHSGHFQSANILFHHVAFDKNFPAEDDISFQSWWPLFCRCHCFVLSWLSHRGWPATLSKSRRLNRAPSWSWRIWRPRTSACWTSRKGRGCCEEWDMAMHHLPSLGRISPIAFSMKSSFAGLWALLRTLSACMFVG
ncbi:Ankrd17 [Symbiodinium sp. CCMP2592]|nr:Ankrd17 [Symbiodinium sp. CCMP2592]